MPDHTITASAGSGGSISPSGAVTVADGGSQSFTATPLASHEVNEWLLDGVSAQDGGNTYGISGVVANHTVEVTFLTIVPFFITSDAVIVAPKHVGVPKTLLSFGEVGWKYIEVDALPAGWSDVAFDDSAWTEGRAAFGDTNTDCSLPEPIYTPWFRDANTYLLVRIHFSITLADLLDPEAVNALSGSIYQQFLNGTQVDIGEVVDDCPTFGNITKALDLVNFVDGDNVLAVALTRPGPDPPELYRSFYDVSIVGLGPLTSDAYIVAGQTITLSSDAVIGSVAVDFTLTSDAVIRRPPLAPGQQNLLSKYLQQQRDALLQKTCTTCAPIDCVDSAGLGYSLESPEFPTVFVCPEGFDCNLIGEDFHLICCDGTVYDLHFSPQISQEDRKRVVDSAIAECARKLAFCNIDPCPTPPCINIWLYWNNAISCTERCPTSNNTFRWTVPAGVYLAFTQEAADQTAGRAACQLAKLHRICFSDLQSTTCIGETYDDEIIISGRFVAAYPNSDTISIIDGALPDGLTLNDGSSFVTGGRVPIRGTPTVGGSFTFTVSIVLGTLNDGFGDTQTRTYTIKVAQIKPDDLPDATIGVAYSQNLSVLPDHDQETEEWSVVTSLPAGLELTKAGILRGTPTGPSESHNVVVKCCFELDHEPLCCSKQYTLTVKERTVYNLEANGFWYVAPGKIGNAFFSGDHHDNLIEHLDLKHFDFTGSFTVRFWVLVDGSFGFQMGNFGGTGWLIGESLGPIRFYFGFSPLINDNLFSSSVTPDVWNRVICSYDAGANLISIRINNGAAISATPNDPLLSSNELFDLILGESGAGLDELGFWKDYVWTDADADFDWNGGAGSDFARSSTIGHGLYAYYKLEEIIVIDGQKYAKGEL